MRSVSIVLLLGACASAPPISPSMAVPLPDSGGLEHVARINDTLYRGAQPDGQQGYRALAEMGIRTVICLRNLHGYREEVESLGMTYVAIPIRADIVSTPPTDEQVERFFETVLDPENQPVFFHCAHGKDRTGTMAALYRIEIDGWTPEQAIEEMQAFGYNDWFQDLIAFVRDYRPRGLGKQ